MSSGRSFSPQASPVMVAALLVLAVLALFATAPRAHGAELIFWDNYRGDPDSIGYANIDGSGGGALNLAGVELSGPEGMAYDSVSGRLFVAGYDSGPDKKGRIIWVNVDGSGAGVLNTAGAPVEEPMGVAVDPATRTIYWVNTDGPGEADGSIAWANLDGAGGGQLNTAGAVIDGPYRLGLDPVSGRVFWDNASPSPETIGYANVNGSGGGTLDLSGATPPEDITGFAVDSAAGRLYWLNSGTSVSFASVNGGGGGDVSLAGAVVDDPYGLAFDPAIGRLYFANYGKEEERAGAIGFANLTGGGGGIDIATAPVDGAQDPVILKSPSTTAAPTLTRGEKAARSTLSCSQGGWGADNAGGFVYQAPRSYAYQWALNGAPIGGATAPTFTAGAPGSYTCTVTGANHVGSASQTSAVAEVKAAKFKLNAKTKKVRAKPGKVATFRIQAVNQGDLEAKRPRLCLKVPKKAKDDLKPRKCKRLGEVDPAGKQVAKLKVKVKPDADPGLYKLKVQVKGVPGKPITAKLKVVE